MGIFIHESWRSCTIRRVNANALPERCIRKVLGRNDVVFQDIYDEHYSKASISRMLEYLRENVSQWSTRSLEAYYPIFFIDCVHMKIHRKRSIETEAFYVELAVREDKRREVLGIFNKPSESVLGWGEMLAELQERGCAEDRVSVCRRVEGSGRCHQCGLSRNPATTLYDAPETHR